MRIKKLDTSHELHAYRYGGGIADVGSGNRIEYLYDTKMYYGHLK